MALLSLPQDLRELDEEGRRLAASHNVLSKEQGIAIIADVLVECACVCVRVCVCV